MTKKETEMIEKIIHVLDTNMALQTEILKAVQNLSHPLIAVTPAPVPVSGIAITNEVKHEEPKIEAPTPAEITPSPATSGKPEIAEPKEVTIEDCRDALATIMKKVGEDQAWSYLKTFKVEMLTDLDKSQYAELVKGAEEILAEATR